MGTWALGHLGTCVGFGLANPAAPLLWVQALGWVAMVGTRENRTTAGWFL